jgi:SpoVK/Ycf46/Vps4 family AAA+-type ATPase
MAAIHNIKEPLLKLNQMVGMEIVKTSIIDQIIYYIQGFHTLGCNKNDFMHTVIYGPPGTGKTEIARCIGEIFSNLGILKNNTFKKVTRADLIAGYLGQTATKTKNVIENSLGGVLFIDEAYALGNNEKGDSFSKECIDTLCESLSDHKENLMVIIAGYEKELQSCFFDYNQGLESRFSWRFKTSNYTYLELYNIFIKKVTEAKWSVSETEPIKSEWFNTNIKYFKSFGRNIETLFAKTKIAHSRRVFCKDISEKTVLTHADIISGFALYKQNEQADIDKKNISGAEHMYL